MVQSINDDGNFPSFSEGLSLRHSDSERERGENQREFPFLFGGTFIEATFCGASSTVAYAFPFLFGGTFIEAVHCLTVTAGTSEISLPFRRDFH